MNPMESFFEKNRWETAIKKSCDKNMNKHLLRILCSPTARCSIYRSILKNNYQIEPPVTRSIPKDDGGTRTLYVNREIDRIILSIYNDLIFELCPHMIDPHCKSYQKNIGIGKIIRYLSRQIQQINRNDIGVKLDLSKYFDSVKREYINEIFDKIDNNIGSFPLTDIIRKYYNKDTVIDQNGKTIEKFTSLKQGCPFSAFLADAVLADVDQTIGQFNVTYIRYSDDIILIGDEWEKAYQTLLQCLAEKNLKVHPQKTEYLYKNQWFKFLGFMLKNDQISLSPKKIKKLDKTIRQLTIRNPRKNQMIPHVQSYLYADETHYSWATAFLPVINNQKDIQTINSFIMDAIRAGITGKTKIGKLSCDFHTTDHFITRSLGANVKNNRKKIPIIDTYQPLSHMRYLMTHDYPLYQEIIQKGNTNYG